jgi:hypothetical protein
MKEQIKFQLARELGGEFAKQIDRCVEATVEALTRWTPVDEELPPVGESEFDKRHGWSIKVNARDDHGRVHIGYCCVHTGC